VRGEQCRAHQPGDARRAVNDDVIGVTGDFRRLAMQRVASKPDDAEQPAKPFLRTLFGPVEGRALRIGVDQHDAPSFPGPFAGEMQRERRLADATLLVEGRHDHRGRLGVFHRSRRSPATEGLDSCRLESKLGGPEVIGLLEENRASGSLWHVCPVPDGTCPLGPESTCGSTDCLEAPVENCAGANASKSRPPGANSMDSR
jgi:hypothetical protein